jgi:hypothetical protein
MPRSESIPTPARLQVRGSGNGEGARFAIFDVIESNRGLPSINRTLVSANDAPERKSPTVLSTLILPFKSWELIESARPCMPKQTLSGVFVVESAEAAAAANAHPTAAVRLQKTLFMAFPHEAPSEAADEAQR